ncbi:MAG: endonuclease/exonuclease/phosphatase family protein [Bacteroidota bacterium]
MPFYKDLDPSDKNDERTIERLRILRNALKAQIPERTLKETLLLATWNIRDFDKPAYGWRMEEAFYYIAEIISFFDIVAIQEVYKDLTALKRVKYLLGSNWKFVFSDTTEGARGNGERIAYLFDKRKIKFGGLAGELVIPPIKTLDGEWISPDQIWRTPLICGFQAGWSRFMVASVHVLFGKGGANSPERINEIRQIAEFLKKRSEDETAWARKLFLLGDFNIFSKKDNTYKVLEENGFVCPEPLKEAYTNVKQNKQYDQILLRERKHSLEILKGGTFNFFDYVFKGEDENLYKPFMKKKNSEEIYKSYDQWRTHQMSDHMPLWVEARIDYSDEYLENKLEKSMQH